MYYWYLSFRTRTVLQDKGLIDNNYNINYQAISEMSESDFLRLRNFGRKSLNEIKMMLSENNLALKVANIDLDEYPAKKRFDTSDRDIEIFRMRSAGETYRSIGNNFSLSAERVRTICLRLRNKMRHPVWGEELLKKVSE